MPCDAAAADVVSAGYNVQIPLSGDCYCWSGRPRSPAITTTGRLGARSADAYKASKWCRRLQQGKLRGVLRVEGKCVKQPYSGVQASIGA